MTLVDLILTNLAVVAGLMLAVWAISVVLRDVSIVDVFWGPGFVAVATVTFILTTDAPRRWPLLLLTAIWGLRLGVHLGRRKFGAPEDDRYQAMRRWIGPSFWIVSLAIVFGLQGVVMIVVALPIMVGQLDPAPLGPLEFAGMFVWAIGFAFESIGDYQLASFRAKPENRGKVLDRGLWAYTRHPNYFGDCLTWWGLFLVGSGSGHWWTIVSPILMSFLLVRVSGVTLLERSLRSSKPGYEAYVARTNAFLPWPPRRT